MGAGVGRTAEHAHPTSPERVDAPGREGALARLGDLPFLAVAFFSGGTGLVYEVIWERLLRIHFGGDAISSFVIVTSFLLGIGLGSYRFRDVRGDPLRRYALLEALIGVYGLASPRVLAALPRAFGGLVGLGLDHAYLVRLAVSSAAFALVLAPATLLGGTLPLMARAFRLRSPSGIRVAGLLYGSNTLGATVAIGCVPLALLNHFTLSTSLGLTASVNLAIAVCCGLSSVRARWRGLGDPSPAPALTGAGAFAAAWRAHAGLVGIVIASGFLTLSWELALFRAFNDIDPLSPYNFPLVLFGYLGALALGSLAFSRWRCESVAELRRYAGVVLLLIALFMLMGVDTAAEVHGRFTSIALRTALYGGTIAWGDFLTYVLVLTVPVGVLLGGVYPVATGVASRAGRDIAPSLGFLYLVSTGGSLLGAVAVQLVGLPLVGLTGTLRILYLGTVGYAAVLLARSEPGRGLAVPHLLLPALVACPFLFVGDSHWRLFSYSTTDRRTEVVEGSGGIARIDWGWGTDGSPMHDPNVHGAVFVNGHYMSQLPDHPKHVALEGIALSIPHRSRVVVLGLGGGVLVEALVVDPLVTDVVAVDWSRELVRLLSRGKARAQLGGVFESPKLRLAELDARIALRLLPARSVDLVVDSLAQAHWSGATHVKSLEYVRMVERTLRPGAIFLFDSNGSPPGTIAALARTFEHVLVNDAVGMYLCSHQPIALDLDMARSFLARRGAAMDPPNPGIEWFRDRFQPIDRASLADVPPIVDDDLSMEYAWRP